MRFVKTKIIFLVWFGLLFQFSCFNNQYIKDASEHYRAYRDFKSLKCLSTRLIIGMTRNDVEDLLGIPDYCPIAGEVYYGATDSRKGLILSYRKFCYSSTSIVVTQTRRLEKIRLEEIRE